MYITQNYTVLTQICISVQHKDNLTFFNVFFIFHPDDVHSV